MDYTLFTPYGSTRTEGEAWELVCRAYGVCKSVLPLLVIKEFMLGGVLAYPVRGKGLEAAPEFVDCIQGARGFDKARIVTKSDHQPAIKDLQDKLSKRRREEHGAGDDGGQLARWRLLIERPC